MDSLQSLWVQGLFFGFDFYFFFNGNILVAGLVSVLSGCLTCLTSTVWGGSQSMGKGG